MVDRTIPAPPAPHDGSHGNVVQRAEPKVKAASIAALLTPLALYYLYRYVPGIAGLPHELDVIVATLVTGATTFAAGFAARAVDRIDLFAAPLAAKVEHAAVDLGDRTIGAQATDDLEAWAHDIAGKTAAPVEHAAEQAVRDVETAAGAGGDPLTAAKADVPAVLDALHTAVADGRAEAETAIAPAVAQATVDAPAVLATVAADSQASPAKAGEDLVAELRALIAKLGPPEATPIGDAAQAAAVPAPAGPLTAPVAAVPAG